MDHVLHIHTQFDEPYLLQSLIEKLASRRMDIGYGKEQVPEDYLAVETSTTEAYVSGTISVEGSDDHLNIPFVTSFIFTCIKSGDDDNYHLNWASSLS